MTAPVLPAPSAVAAALCTALPLPAVEVRASDAATVPVGALRQAVVAAFVGAVGAELAVALLAPEALAAGDPRMTAAVMLRPALEAAVTQLGHGVLQDPRSADASSLFADPTASVFELRSAGDVAGWFVLRMGERAPGALDASEVAERLSRISSVEMTLTVEIGRTKMPVRTVLGLEAGTVVELDRSAGAPADILLNGRRIALGEVVVVDQDYAVRVTKILDVAEGLQ